MRVRHDQAYRDFLTTPQAGVWRGVRIKQIRHRTLYPGGRARVTLFESVDDGRSHPRLQTQMPPAQDPSPPGTLFSPAQTPRSAGALRTLINDALRAQRAVLNADDLDMSLAPRASPRYWKNSIRTQRIAALFRQIRGHLDTWLASGALAGSEARAARRTMREMEDEVYSGIMAFDDSDIGTYHSYRNDEPFVHYLESLISSLPREGTEAFAVLPSEEQYAVRRQLTQLYNHLDFLMRHKYAFDLIDETDIERTLGGFMIDKASRHIVSEVPDRTSLVPRFELLRIDPGARHRYAGAWVYRDGRGGICLQDGTPIQVPSNLLRSSPRTPSQLTFRRAPRHPRLRPGMRFDWDGNGYVRAGKIQWVSWAGHCDVKAAIEQLGLTLDENPTLTEYRSDTDASRSYDRRLLLEMIASMIELGSVYRRMDGTGMIRRGRQRFGGARNDSLPDRLQFSGARDGSPFRWPMSARQEEFVIRSMAFPGQGGALQRANLGTIFYHNLPDVRAVDFYPNQRFLGTVEGDYNVIDVSGALIEADITVDEFDENTGYPVQKRQRTTIDLRPQPSITRCYLGSYVANVHSRRLYQVYLDRTRNRILGEMFVYEQRRGKWRPRQLRSENFEVPLARPLRCTASREMKRDHPAMYQTLLETAMRTGQNISADTDMTAPVWNGVVTRLDVRKLDENVQARTQRWRVDIHARYGRATLDYLVRRNEAGEPVDYCPAVPDDAATPWPDFFWQEFPDVGTKGRDGAAWIVNAAMLDRDLVSIHSDRSVQGGFYVHDDHIKNVFEIIYTVLAGYRYSIVHDNKRYGFASRADWDAAVAELKRRRAALSFQR